MVYNNYTGEENKYPRRSYKKGSTMANKEERNMFELVNIGKRIADARRAKGMTQMALADALGIS